MPNPNRTKAIALIFRCYLQMDPKAVPFDTMDRNHHAEFAEACLTMVRAAYYLMETRDA